MPCRFLFAFFCIIGAETLLAATDWDCRQGEDGQWECVTERTPEEPAPQPTPPAPPPTRTKPKPVRSATPIPRPAPEPEAVAQAEGWSCQGGEESQNWDCTLVGPDPQGQPKIMEEAGAEYLAAFDARERQLFRNMADRLTYDPWAVCHSTLNPPVDHSVKDLRETAPMLVDADFSEVFDEEVTTFLGNVNITRADQNLQAERAGYNALSRTLTAQGNVLYTDQDLAVFTDSAFLRLATEQARLRNTLFILNSVPARGKAGAIYRDTKTFSRYRDVAYTTCPPGNEDWVLHTSQMKIDQADGTGSARHAWLDFKGIPFLYTPYISFPIDSRRKSGLLAPSFSSNDDTGADFSVPYYWNIAPNLDATITPRYTIKRGGLLRTELRYLTPRNHGFFEGEYMPQDTERKEARGQVVLQHRTRFKPNLVGDIGINWVSDEDYLDELGNSLSFSNQVFLRSHGQVNYFRPGIHFSTLVENFQTVDKTIPERNKPYRRLPRVMLNFAPNMEKWPVRFTMDNEYVFFQRTEAALIGEIALPEQAQRLDLKPSVSFPLRTPGTFLIPKASLQHTQYWLNGNDFGTRDTITRTLPILSLDGGLLMERPFAIGQRPYVHTLEPRVFYLYVPFTDQDDIPILDTSAFDFNFGQLFRENRFNGSDRINDANQVTLALTSRLVDAASGRERLSASIGQIYFFEDRRVSLPRRRLISPDLEDSGLFTDSTTTSNLVAEVNGMITDNILFRTGMQWNPDGNQFDRAQASLHYRAGDNDIFNIGYRFREETDLQENIQQGDISFRWPIAAGWSAMGRWLYSFRDNLTLDSFVGVEKESCCWRVRLLGRRFINRIDNPASTRGDTQTGIFFQLELKGLTSFGDNVERFLDKNLPGYRILPDR